MTSIHIDALAWQPPAGHGHTLLHLPHHSVLTAPADLSLAELTGSGPRAALAPHVHVPRTGIRYWLVPWTWYVTQGCLAPRIMLRHRPTLLIPHTDQLTGPAPSWTHFDTCTDLWVTPLAPLLHQLGRATGNAIPLPRPACVLCAQDTDPSRCVRLSTGKPAHPDCARARGYQPAASGVWSSPEPGPGARPLWSPRR